MERTVFPLLQGAAAARSLARYDGGPALFMGHVPEDAAPGWTGAQLPRCVYRFEWMSGVEQLKAGSLILDVLCDKDDEAARPELLAEAWKRELSEMFFTDGECACSLIWSSAEQFALLASEREVVGATVVFDVFQYPAQTTFAIDPIAAINRWTKEVLPGATVIGVDAVGSGQKPSFDAPVIYWRATEMSVRQRRADVVWYDAQLAGHVFASEPNGRLRLLRGICEALAMEQDGLDLSDGSPLYLDKLRVDTASTYGADGRVALQASFGVPRAAAEAPILRRVNMNRGKGNGEG